MPDIDFSYTVDESGAVALAIVRAEYDIPLNIPFLPEFSLHFAAENAMPVAAA